METKKPVGYIVLHTYGVGSPIIVKYFNIEQYENNGDITISGKTIAVRESQDEITDLIVQAETRFSTIHRWMSAADPEGLHPKPTSDLFSVNLTEQIRSDGN